MISLDWVSLITLAGSAIGFFLALVLFGMRRPPRLPHLLLGGFLAAYSLSNTGAAFTHSGLLAVYPHAFGIFTPFVMLVGPLLYLYILSLTVPDFRLRPVHALNGLPFFVTEATFAVAIYFQGAEDKLNMVRRLQTDAGPWVYEAAIWFRSMVLLAFLVLCGLALRRYARTVRDNFSTLERISLNWLRLLVAAYGVGFVLVLVLAQADVPDPPLHIAEALIILIIGLRGLTQPEIFAPGTRPAGETKPSTKYERSSLTPEQADRAQQLLRAVMESDKLYLDEELSLTALSEKIGLASSYVSQVLNERLQKSFYDFVNGYRVEEAKRILRDPRKSGRKILAVALDSGFASKPAFNRIFKRHTGMTPSEYKARTFVRPG